LGSRGFSHEELQEYRSLTDHFRDVAGWADDGVVLDVEGDEERQALSAIATFATESYFTLLGVRPILGAGLPAAGSAAGATAPVAVISHAAWDQLFGRSPDVVGATLKVNGVPVTIAGVAPPRFNGMTMINPFKLWLPLSHRPLLVPEAERGADWFHAAARLRPGVSLDAATAAVRVVAARAAADMEEPAERPDDRRLTIDTRVVPLTAGSGDPSFEREMWPMTAGLTMLGLLILLVTCTNVSALLTGLAMARRREIAIRLSLGAARTRIIRQLLTESVLLAMAAIPAALGMVWMVQRAVIAFIPELPLTMGVSWPAAVFTFGVALAVGMLFGLSPALHATRLTVASALKDSTSMIAGSRARLQRGLVVAQIAVTQPLVVGVVALLLMLLGAYQREGLNEFADRIISLRLRPAAATPALQDQDPESMQRRHAEMLRLRERLEAIPGVARAVQDPRFTAELDGYSVHPEDRIPGGLQESLRLSAPMVAPGYFAVMGIPLVLGREFAPTEAGFSQEHAGAEIPVVIETDLARRLWPGANPIGRRLQPAADSPLGGHTLSVVGVVDQPVDEGRVEDFGYQVYLPPDSARAGASLAMLIRTTSDAKPLIPTIRSVVREALPGIGIANLRTVAEIEARLRQDYFLAVAVLAGGGFLALFLAAFGLYAVVAFAVGQRTSEIAVRMAVGARARQIIGKFIGDGLRLSAFGLVVGLPLSLIGLRMLMTVPDLLLPVRLAPVAATAAFGALAVSVAATWLPARRAAAVDPATILRRE
ncbi:MAG: ABC transporter permease, partial [Gemmatimonadota bacterium]|nr:ABC transporter permease [Gemmatimonadota bacterium]